MILKKHCRTCEYCMQMDSVKTLTQKSEKIFTLYKIKSIMFVFLIDKTLINNPF